jgi:hypothetical protein
MAPRKSKKPPRGQLQLTLLGGVASQTTPKRPPPINRQGRDSNETLSQQGLFGMQAIAGKGPVHQPIRKAWNTVRIPFALTTLIA